MVSKNFSGWITDEKHLNGNSQKSLVFDFIQISVCGTGDLKCIQYKFIIHNHSGPGPG